MTRQRLLIIGGAIAAGLVVGVAIAWAVSRGSEPGASPTASPSGDFISDAPSITAAVPDAEFDVGSVVATSDVDELSYFDAAAGTEDGTLTKFSYYGQPLTLLAIAQAEVDSETWYQVLLPIQPNQSTGWIRAEDVTVFSTDVEVHIYVEERELELVEDGVTLLSADVALGKDETPTPPGIYSVTDPLDFTHNDTGVYGAFALGLSGFSEVLETFNGGPPQIAIHGTNQPELIGQYVSNGCIRMTNENILILAENAKLGTPVYIHASRAEAEAD